MINATADKLQFKAVLFDLDGTLVQSAGEIVTAVNDTLENHHYAPIAAQQITNWIGKGTAWLMLQAISFAADEEIDKYDERFKKVYPEFIERYAKLAGTRSQLFPGVVNTLKTLKSKGIKTGVVTNKPRELSVKILDGTRGFLYHIDILVAGGDTQKAKPDPQPLFYALEQMELCRRDVLFVGDSEHDIQAARSAKMTVWAMSYGYNHGRNVADSHPDMLLDKISEVAERLEVNTHCQVTHSGEMRWH